MGAIGKKFKSGMKKMNKSQLQLYLTFGFLIVSQQAYIYQ